MYINIWLIHFVVQQKLTQHCKATIAQFKKKMLKDEYIGMGEESMILGKSHSEALFPLSTTN